MDLATAGDILRHKPAKFGDADLIAANRLLTEAAECAEWLSEKDSRVMLEGLKNWFQLLDTCELVEIENLLWRERRSRR